jgi:hypothetical protein
MSIICGLSSEVVTNGVKQLLLVFLIAKQKNLLLASSYSRDLPNPVKLTQDT